MRNLVNCSHRFNMNLMTRTVDNVFLIVNSNIFINKNSWNFRHPMRLFLERFIRESKRSDLVYVDDNRHYADLFKSVQLREINNFTILTNYISAV